MPPDKLNPDLQFCASSREEWRAWLQQNHAGASEIWLVYFKKHTGKPTVDYAESVEEALCFGWVDGLKKRIDEYRYAHRFSPRKAKSKWTPLNIQRARKMIEAGKMTEAGLVSFRQRLEYDEKFLQARTQKKLELPAEMEAAIKLNKAAWNNFKQLAPGYRKQYVGWLVSAKKPATRTRRLEEAIRLLARNKKLGMK
ncbi:MAG: YdeI/OmpD-associated family protein [Gammaproteobacteria bacterium]|nr:YdeI/OmpD-associated family protein [Gammaproteobacteria bacterium]